MMFPSPRWTWLKRGMHTEHPPTRDDIMTSVHKEVQALAAVFRGPGWYPQVRALVEEVDSGFKVTFWDCDLMLEVSKFLVLTSTYVRKEGTS
jgi:hypothetical protein